MTATIIPFSKGAGGGDSPPTADEILKSLIGVFISVTVIGYDAEGEFLVMSMEDLPGLNLLLDRTKAGLLEADDE